jgi:uncharacterized protein (TIGR02996 family)
MPGKDDFLLVDNPAWPSVLAALEGRFARRRPPPADEVTVSPATGPTDEDGLVRALFAAPHDELARAAYADWLQENGSPLHARLLRLPPRDPGREEILEAIGRPIVGAFRHFNMVVGEEDGLIHVCLPLRFFLVKAFQRDGPAWLPHNRISNLMLFGESKDWTRVGGTPLAGHLRGLWLRSQNLRDRGLAQLAAATGLANLGSLELDNARIGEAGVLALASSTNFPRLCHLDLGRAKLSAEGVRALAGGPLAASLRYLDLGMTRLHDAGVAVLAQSPGLSGLVTLKVAGNSLSDEGVQSLAASPHLGQLRDLDLSNNYTITDAGVLTLARSALASRLRWLRMRNVRASSEAWRALTEALPPGGHLSLE